MAKDKLIVALDLPELSRVQDLVTKLGETVGLYKVGMELYYSCGPEVLDFLHQAGKKVFLDLKFHDIPNTVAKAARTAVRRQVFMFNVHASGGFEMMRRAVEEAEEEASALGVPRPLLLGVTVLTSLTGDQLSGEIGINGSVEEVVLRWAALAQKAGLDGVVASPLEIKRLKKVCGPDFLIVTPGVRPRGSSAGDQKRFTTPGEAVALGADYIVIGRPVTKAVDPVEATRDIIKEMEESLCCQNRIF